MRSRSPFVVLAVVLGIGSGAICSAQQQPASVSPPQKDQNTPLPSGDQTQTPVSPSQTEGQAQTATPTQSETQQTSPTTKKATTAAKKKKPVKRHAASTQSEKVVVRNGGAKDNSGQLTPAMSPDQELHSRENTAQLLAITDSNLKKVTSQQLSTVQQSMLHQIRTYVRQAKAASDSGDLTRAHTLAYKAHLLSDALAGK